MTTYRPIWLDQLPDCSCVISGHCLGGENCAAASTAVQIDRSTLGRTRPSVCSVRRKTGDVSGGLTIGQVAEAARSYGVTIVPRTGSNVATPKQLASWLKQGRSVQVNIGTRPLLGTKLRSTAGAINHDVFVNEGRGWDEDGYPDEVLVYDSAANGRNRDYHVDQGPTWWPWYRLLQACAALQPWGEQDPRVLGPGRIYCGYGPDTEPHVILRWGARKTKPFPDRTRANKRTAVRRRPDRVADTDIVRYLDDGDLFTAYQVTLQGVSSGGSRTWYGDQSGTQWVHGSRLDHKGGST